MNEEFTNYLNGIPFGDYKKTCDKIIAECKINPEIFKNWKSGRTAIPELAKPIIEEIARKTIF